MLRSGTQKEGGPGTNMLGLGCIEIKAQQNWDVEMFRKQMEAQNYTDLLKLNTLKLGI